MRRGLKIMVWSLAAAVLLVAALGGSVMVAGNTDAGRAWIERLTYRLSSGTVKVSGLGGDFPARLTLRQLQLIDSGGVWLTGEGISLQWSPAALLERRIRGDWLQVARLAIERGPISQGHGGSVSIPDIEVDRFSADRVELGAPLVGTAAALSLRGSLRLRSLENANADVVAHRLDGDGEYTLHLRFDPQRMDGALAVHEPASGPLENLLTLPGLGALSATVTLQGPRDAERIDAVIAAGDLHARLQGSVDLTHSSADLRYSLTAPAMAPRPDLRWTSAALQGSWHGSVSTPTADGRLTVEGLLLAGSTRMSRLSAELAASAGQLAIHAVVGGLEIPGPQPRFFAKDPVRVDASLQLDQPSKPVEFTATHPLLSLRGHADTRAQNGGPQSVGVELRLPDLAPYAVFTGQDVAGNAVLDARLVHGPSDDALTLDGNIGLSGGTAAWVAMIGPRITLQLSGSMTDTGIKIANLRIAGRTLTFTAGGNATRTPPSGAATAAAPGTGPGFLKDLDTRWQLNVPNLAALSSDVAGDLKVSGRLAGPPTSLVGDAELTSQLSVRGSASGTVQASLHARGLPTAPGGTLRAHGMVDGAPLSIDAALERGSGGIHLTVRQADWKSAHAEGDLTADTALNGSHGQLRMRVDQLGDFSRLLGINLAGGVEGTLGFLPGPGQPQAQLQVDGKNLALGQFRGDAHLRGSGGFAALALQLTAQLPDLYGTAANLSSAATLDLGTRELHIATAALGYRGESLRLLSPATLSFAKGVAVDELKLGARDAIFELKGQLAPSLDLSASLRRLNPGLVNVFLPDLLAGGTIEAQARLQGPFAAPSGDARVDASGIRFADDAATGLPALDLHARTDLSGGMATLNAKLTAGSGSQMTASGTLPLAADGAFDVKIGGKLDVGLANPLLEARGLRAAGQLQVDATVTGSPTAPQVGGGITLTGGSLRDYARGVTLSNITADVVGSEGALRIKSFKATAASGSVGMTGTFGVLQAGMPVDLTITAKNAQPIASNIITANLDANVHVTGKARERIDVAGTLQVNKATIGIPDSLPPDVAVLDVRRRGRPAPAAADKQLVIGLDLAIHAPQQILVQGRGIDAELGGDIKLGGTSDAPLASGGFDLQRGSFTIAGSTLSFTQGRVSFDGAGLRNKVDPTLDFTAQTTLSNSTATLHITGVADAPRFEFTSTSGLAQDEIMAQLLFGENAAQLTALQAAQIGAALATLSGVGGSGLNPLVKLQKTLGLDRLTVGANTTTTATGATENSGAAIAAGRYVSKRVYVEAKQTTTGTSQVQVDVDLTKHLKLQTRLGNGTAITQGTTPENDPGSSVGLSYQFEY